MTWLEQPDTKKTRHTEEAFKTKHLIISFFFFAFTFSLSWKFWPELVGKYVSFVFLV